jgi:hypothetical protein
MREIRVDAHIGAQRAVERPSCRRALETGEAAAGVGAATRSGTRHELTALEVEAL